MLSGPYAGDPRPLSDSVAMRMRRRLNDHLRDHHIGCGLACEEYRRSWLALAVGGEVMEEEGNHR